LRLDAAGGETWRPLDSVTLKLAPHIGDLLEPRLDRGRAPLPLAPSPRGEGGGYVTDGMTDEKLKDPIG